MAADGRIATSVAHLLKYSALLSPRSGERWRGGSACLNWQPFSPGYNSDGDSCQLRGQELSFCYLWVQCCALEGFWSPVVAAGPGCSANSSSPAPEALAADKILWSAMHGWICLSISGSVGWFSQKAGLLCELTPREVASMWLPGGLSRLCGCRGAAGRSQCPPVPLNVQQHVWAACGSTSRWVMEIPPSL